MENITSKIDLQEWRIETYFYKNYKLPPSYNSWNIPFFFSILYLSVIYFGKEYMSNKTRYSLRPALFLWSAFLAVFSILGTYRTFLIAYEVFRRGGVINIIRNTTCYTDPISRWWISLFCWSKFVEYIDTVFIILRKQPLIFLHWYHHVTVALYAWLMTSTVYSGGLVFMCMNFFVHSFMYTYYAIRAAGFKLPRIISISITSLQIAQMFIGCFTMISLWLHSNRSDYITSSVQLWGGSIMYVSYLLLFGHFFYKTYLSPGPKRKSQQETSTKQEVNGVDTKKQKSSESNGSIDSSNWDLSKSNGSIRKRKN